MNEYLVSVAAKPCLLFFAATLSYNIGAISSIDVEPNYLPYHYSAPVSVSINSVSSITGDAVVDYYQPRTELGKKLLALRREYVINGGRLLAESELADEIHLRRGGVLDV